MRAAVLGSPIAHSLSPVLHRAAYADLGLAWSYEAVECTVERLPGLLAGLGPEWAGLSLTMPLKAAVLPLLDDVDEVVRRSGAANTVVLAGGRRGGANTDVPGLSAALTAGAVTAAGSRATVLGAGATARSAVLSLALAGFRGADVVARRPTATADLVAVGRDADLAVSVHPWEEAVALLDAGLVVSTVPAGVADPLAGSVPSRPGVLLDVVYAPWPTPLATAWTAAGGAVIGGLELLLQQAALQVRLMTGLDVDAPRLVAVMRGPGEAELARRWSVAG